MLLSYTDIYLIDRKRVNPDLCVITVYMYTVYIYCRSGNIREVLIFVDFARKTNSRIQKSRKNNFYNGATREKLKFANSKLREKLKTRKITSSTVYNVCTKGNITLLCYEKELHETLVHRHVGS